MSLRQRTAAFLDLHTYEIGDRVTFRANGRQRTGTIVEIVTWRAVGAEKKPWTLKLEMDDSDRPVCVTAGEVKPT